MVDYRFSIRTPVDSRSSEDIMPCEKRKDIVRYESTFSLWASRINGRSESIEDNLDSETEGFVAGYTNNVSV